MRTKEFNDKIGELTEAGAKVGFVLYNFCFRKVGVGIMWYDESRHVSPEDWRKGLLIEKYYDSFGEAIDSEIKRLVEKSNEMQTER